MRLCDYINEIGVDNAAQLFGVTRSAVVSWRHRYRLPKPATAVAIEAATGGRVTIADVYADGIRPQHVRRPMRRASNV
jgi:DNA-binding transcriptional regulator YdaS (Cro superfamily)